MSLAPKRDKSACKPQHEEPQHVKVLRAAPCGWMSATVSHW
jgi:hypothetical protein